jgi:hypothetical protein
MKYHETWPELIKICIWTWNYSPFTWTSSGHIIGRIISQWSVTVDTQIQSCSSQCGICVGQTDIGTGFLCWVLKPSPVCVIPFTCSCNTDTRGTQITGARSLWQQNFVQRRQIFVGPQHGTCFMSPSCRLEFLNGYYVFGNLCTPDCYYIIIGIEGIFKWNTSVTWVMFGTLDTAAHCGHMVVYDSHCRIGAGESFWRTFYNTNCNVIYGDYI